METSGLAHADIGWAGSLWMFAAPQPHPRDSVSGSCLFIAPLFDDDLRPLSCRRSPGPDLVTNSLRYFRLLGTPQAPTLHCDIDT